MSGDQISSSVYIGLCLVLVASSLALRRLPRGKMLSLGAIWAAIILAVWAIVSAARSMG